MPSREQLLANHHSAGRESETGTQPKAERMPYRERRASLSQQLLSKNRSSDSGSASGGQSDIASSYVDWLAGAHAARGAAGGAGERQGGAGGAAGGLARGG